jgi:hypothetical protein
MIYDDIRRDIRKEFEIAFLECLGFTDDAEKIANELMYETGKVIWERMSKSNNSREMNHHYEEFIKKGEPFGLTPE